MPKIKQDPAEIRLDQAGHLRHVGGVTSLRRYLFPALALLCLGPWISAPAALVGGIFFSLALGNPWPELTQKLVPWLLGLSIVGLGAGSDIGVVGHVGLHGVGYTVAGIALTMTIGLGLGRALKVNRDLALLLSVGTAICGGSAIAAAASTLRSKSTDVSVALASVFLLNALALLLFPWIGHQLHLSETAFGFWSALAIHDTSSVVGAALSFGPRSLEVATTLKLVRALWIVPVTIVLGLIWARDSQTPSALARLKRMWFIIGFVIAAALVTAVPALREPGLVVASGARRCFVVTLFLIGAGLSPRTIRSVGTRALVHAFLLWVFVASVTLEAIYRGWVS